MTASSEPHVYVFADGSCASGQDAPGSWGAAVLTKQHTQLLFGALYPTTISRCELYPVVESLRYIRDVLTPHRSLPVGFRVLLVSDSEYVVKTIGGLYEASKNDDLWQAYHALADKLDITALHRGRNSHPLMCLVDSMAYATYKEFGAYGERLLSVTDLPSFDMIGLSPLRGTLDKHQLQEAQKETQQE